MSSAILVVTNRSSVPPAVSKPTGCLTSFHWLSLKESAGSSQLEPNVASVGMKYLTIALGRTNDVDVASPQMPRPYDLSLSCLAYFGAISESTVCPSELINPKYSPPLDNSKLV